MPWTERNSCPSRKHGNAQAVKVLAHSSIYYAALKVEPYASLSHWRWFRVGHFRCSHLAPPFCCDVNAVQELKDDDDAGDGGVVANQGHVTPSCASHSLVVIMSKQATSWTGWPTSSVYLLQQEAERGVITVFSSASNNAALHIGGLHNTDFFFQMEGAQSLTFLK